MPKLDFDLKIKETTSVDYVVELEVNGKTRLVDISVDNKTGEIIDRSIKLEKNDDLLQSEADLFYSILESYTIKNGVPKCQLTD